MGSICGIIYKRKQAKEEHIKVMLESMAGWEPDYTAYKVEGNAALGVHVLYSMEYSELERMPWEDKDSLYVYDGRFDPPSPEASEAGNNLLTREAGADAPPLPEASADEDGLAWLKTPAVGYSSEVQEKYRKFVLDYLVKNFDGEKPGFKGDFTVARWEKVEEKLTLVRDHLGTRPLFYTETEEFFAFATEMKALLMLPEVSDEWDEQWIADSISTVKSEKFRTPYKNISRLLPAHTLSFDGKEIKLQKYWDLVEKTKWSDLSEKEAVRIFLEKLIRAVDRRVRHAISVGSELSGGLDSSGVTALAWPLMNESGRDFFALSHGFSDENLGKYFPYKDEREFSLALVEFAGIKEHIFCTAEDYGVVDILKKTLEIQSAPVQQGYNVYADSLYDEAQKRNVRVILSGFGGDEGVTSKSGGHVQELSRKKNWKKLKEEIMNTTGQKRFGGLKGRLKYFVLRYFPSAFKLIQKFLAEEDWRVPKWKALALDPDFAEKMRIKERYFDRVGFPDDPDVRARQYKRILHNHVSQRFEYSYLAALYRRMEYAYPLWDIDLVEFYYSLPSHLKVKNGIKRYIYREAMKGILPEKIRTRDDKTGATVPTVQQRFLKDYHAIRELILEAQKENNNHYLDYEKMLKWQERMRDRGFNDKVPANPGAFFNGLMVLLWQRTGGGKKEAVASRREAV